MPVKKDRYSFDPATVRALLRLAVQALEGLAERPNGYHDCSDYERGYGDAWAAKANMASAALKNIDSAIARKEG